ncbi:MAG: RNA-directed DNA polymerase [Clostridium perfringens]|nr:RNA-directed DNA polymerase [Clostridium perfringens]
MDKYSEFSLMVLNKIFYNKDVYGKQLKDIDGKVIYNTAYDTIDANKIRYMLLNKGSIMTYQQKLNKLKWLCLDFDIKSGFLDDGYNFEEDNEYKPKLFSEVNLAANYLKEHKISYLMEYSGNRGIHIWIFLNEEVSKEVGYQIVNKIYNDINFQYIINDRECIALDLFPKNGVSKGNKIGLGVKIPLSFHLKSNSYSYCIKDISEVLRCNKLDEDFIGKQIDLLNSSIMNDVGDIISKLQIEDCEYVEEYDECTGVLNQEKSYIEIMEQLKKCSVLKYILEKPLSKLSSFDRTVLVGTLVRVKSRDNDEFGKEWLVKYFASDNESYNEEITNSKIELLSNLYPPTIKFLEKKYNMQCHYCNENNIKNTLQLLDDVELKSVNKDEKILKWIIKCEKRYLALNDEIPLNYILDELNNLDLNELLGYIKNIKNNDFKEVKYYKFIRHEEQKERTLYSLSAKDRVISSFIMKEINKMLYGLYSNSSYSYRLNNNMLSDDIFISWNKLWMKYVRDIEDKIYSKSYDDYYIIKLDLKSFYDHISIPQLREMLYHKPTKSIEYAMYNIPQSEVEEYKNMCEYLLQISERITEHNRGVPQGPAYARYLAELYLVEVDKLIVSFLKSDFEYYFRYVDDMVILVQDEERGKELYSKIAEKVQELSLELNEKCIQGKVADLKYEITKQDVTKYFIDGIDENTPELVKDKAKSLLNKMIGNNEEFDVKQLPFYLTHLIDNRFLDSKKDKIIDYIINTNIGRGSMFKYFYKNILFKNNNYDTTQTYYKNIQGLSRGNYLNELSKHIQEINDVNHIKEVVNYYIDEGLLEEYELNEVYRIILISGIDCEIDINDNNVFDLVANILINTKNIKWSDNLFEKFLVRLQRVEDSLKVVTILDKILENSLFIPNLNSIINTIYAIIYYRKFESNRNYQQYIYNLVTFLTLYLDNDSKIRSVWKKVIEYSSEKPIEIKYNDWYKYENNVSKASINDAGVVFFLLEVLNDNGMIIEQGTSEIEKECASYLIMFLFNGRKSNKFDDKIDELKEVLASKKLTFLLWCLEKDVQYFPCEKVALRNLYLNNRIILKKQDKLIVRSTTNVINETIVRKKLCIEKEEEEWFKETKYSYGIIKLSDKLVNLYDKLNNMSFYDAISFVLRVNREAVCNNKYINVFEKGTFKNSSNEFYIDISKYDNALVIDEERTIQNNRRGFLNELLSTLYKANIKDKIYDLERVYKISNFKEDFIPNIIKDVEEEVAYVEYIYNKINLLVEKYGEDLYSIELSKILAISKFISKQKVTKYSKYIELLKYYNSLYKNNVENFIFYSKVESKCDNLGELINTIIRSINGNYSAYDEVKGITQFLQDEKNKIIDLINRNQHDFKEITLFKRVEINSSLSENQIKIDGENTNIENLNYFEFGSENETRQLEIKDTIELINNNFIYLYNGMIVRMPNVIEKIIEIIETKVGDYDKKNYKVEIEITNCEFYQKAIEVIMNQSDVNKYEAQKRISNFLSNVSDKYFDVILKVIAKHRYMTKEELNSFVNAIIKYTGNENTCILQLKKITDDNGLHQIVYFKNKELFDRGTVNRSRLEKDYNKINNDEPVDNIVILRDISISGGQFKKTIEKLLNGNNSGLQKINKEKLEKLLNNNVRITILSCLYTNYFEEKIRNFFDKYGYDEHNLIFEGVKIDYKNYLFKNCLENKKERELFKEFINTYYSDFDKDMPGTKFKKYIDNIEDDRTSNMLITRYKSMPKFHLLILSEQRRIFNYRVD